MIKALKGDWQDQLDFFFFRHARWLWEWVNWNWFDVMTGETKKPRLALFLERVFRHEKPSS